MESSVLLNLHSKSQEKRKNVGEWYRNGSGQAPKTDVLFYKVCLRLLVFTFKPICILPLHYNRETFLPSGDGQKVWALELHRPWYEAHILLLKMIWPCQSLGLNFLPPQNLHNNNTTWD